MTKQALREKYLGLRHQLSANEMKVGNVSITEQLKQTIDFSAVSTIHLFLPIEQQHEVNLWEFVHWVWQQHPTVKLVVPKCNFATRSLVSCLLTATTPLSTENYGIPEPIDPLIIDPKQLDVVVTPLLVCDKQGHRVGYGKGFYDAFFNTCRPDVQKIGVGFFTAIDKISDIDKWDIPLNTYICPLR